MALVHELARMADDNTTRALREIAALLSGYDEATDWGCGNQCEGCQYEMAEAARIAKEALADA